ncbi:MAG: formate--tetrahydrofolate ligase, partial [Myxococcota bacterium]
MQSDLEIAQAAELVPVADIATSAGIASEHLELFGKHKAKVHLDARGPRRGKYVVVTAITPTPLGEGKTTTTVGLGQGIGSLGKTCFVTIRQPSMGPTFGIKGGAAG